MTRYAVLAALLGACVSIDPPGHAEYYEPIEPTTAPIIDLRQFWAQQCGRGSLEKREQCLQAKEREHDAVKQPRKRRIRK